MRRVSPLLFIAAFDYAPYPGTAGLRFSLSRLPCVGLHPRGFTVSSIDNGIARSDPSMPQPIWPGIMRPQPSGIIALTYRGTFLCQSQNSRPKPFRHPCVQWWRDFPHDLLSRRLLFLSRLLHGLPRYYMLSRGAAELGSSSAYL